MEHYSIIDRSVVDRPVTDRAISERPIAERPLSERPIGDHAIGDQIAPRLGADPELEASELESELELDVAHGGVGGSVNPRVASPSVSAGIAAANALAAAGEAGWHVGPRFPGEDGGHSMAEMAQRDLDAALQLLADRAQYITGAGGAAIALRRDERKEMLCRASSGAKAPQLGALLSTESGLSGESVRTRMPLRCDDAEHDPRVNRESCRELGIASVMIVPIMGEDRLGRGQVLGVFELFSGQADAFAERDLSALQRLGEMVETAVKLARAAEGAPPEMVAPDMEIDAADLVVADGVPSDITTEIATEVTVVPRGTPGVLESAGFADEGPVLEVDVDEVAVAEAVVAVAPAVEPAVPFLPPQAVVAEIPAVVAATPAAVPPAVAPAGVAPAKEQPAKRPLMWSAAVQASPDASKPGETDQSHVPPMLRSLRKCKACGFPVSEGRALCVECDEKQWRGQPLPATAGKTPVTGPAVDFRQGGLAESAGLGSKQSHTASAAAVSRAITRSAVSPVTPSVSLPKTVSSAPPPPVPVAAQLAPQSLAAALAELNEQEKRLEAARRGEPVAVPLPVPAAAVEPAAREAVAVSIPVPVSVPVSVPASAASEEISTGAKAVEAETKVNAAVEPVREVPQNPASFDFSGGLGASESWLGRNKYILGAILVIAAVVAGIVWLR